MKFPFSYHRAVTTEDALHHLTQPGAAPLGGGTDLLVTIEEEIARPSAVIDLRALPLGRGGAIELLDAGGLRIDASVSLTSLARDAVVRARFPALSDACTSVGTPALRNMATLGGNLCQRPRCWYFRRGVSCLKNGGSGCPARLGENQYHAIVDAGPCWAVHPSDPAVALTALEAELEVRSATATERIPISDFYTLPSVDPTRETVLEAGQIITAVILPGAAAGGAQIYRKLMQRGAWDFALASIAACKRPSGDVRIVLGGIAPRPWRVGSSIEEDVSSGGLDDDAIDALVMRALLDAEPLSKNAYKVDLAASLLRDAIRAVA